MLIRKTGKLLWNDSEKNLIIGIFENKNSKGTTYGIVSITALQGNYKQTMCLSISEWNRLLKFIERVPPIKNEGDDDEEN